ncbi:unnamed protein product [Rodentolepis nana]|uniref:Fibronectin type-III domain-containing protein n=1 Tax=Rodentolepis nana TaxID=102285 RepID=A0A0R3TD43_RODNA|nr:unnamed protein product [Rodentolepis nana]
MWQYIVLVNLVAIANVVFSQAPITWPDPRHFTISLDRASGRKVIATWKVEEYCSENKLEKFEAFATGPNGSEIKHERNYRYDDLPYRVIVLDKASTKYTITGTVKTRFVQGNISATLTVVSGVIIYSKPIIYR